MASNDLLSTAWSSVKSWVCSPEVVYMPTRSDGASAPNNRVAAFRTERASCMDILTSSKTKETKRCGSTAVFTGAVSPAVSMEGVGLATGWIFSDSGVSTLKVEITWGLRLSKS